MTLAPRLRKVALTAHIAVSVGVLGAIASFLALVLSGLRAEDAAALSATYQAAALLTWYVVIPLIFASLLTGVVSSLGTPWGLFQYYWVVAKIALTTLATIVLLLQLRLIDYMASKSATGFLLSEDLRGAKSALAVHAAGGLLVLVLVTILSVYKPRGMTMYGQSKLRDQQAAGRQ